MRLTDAEYKVFKTHFHCTSSWDEEYHVPFDVEIPAGTATWRAYTSGPQFHAGIDWLNKMRQGS